MGRPAVPDRASVQKRRPRLAILAHGIHDDGGMERAFAELIRRIHDRYEIVVLSIDLAEPLRELVEWHRIPAPRRPAAIRFLVYYLLAGLRLPTVRADLVHSVGAIVPNRVDLSSVHFSNVEFVAATGGLAPREAPPMRRLNTAIFHALAVLAERWSYRPSRVAYLAPVSEGLARGLRRYYPRIPIEVAPNGIDRSRFSPDVATRLVVREQLGFEEDDVLVLFVGGDWHRKGLDLAIEALAIAAERSRERLRLVVVGRGDEQAFRRAAERAGSGDAVVFLGSRRDTERFYAAADVFLLPSSYETFSLAAYEAAASRLPVVATPVHGVVELVGDGVAGFIVERTVTAIAGALETLAHAPALRRSLGDAALARAVEFTWERSAEATQSMYRSLLEQHENLGLGIPV
jgi:UDP-glucose:(heptosyl)LPS alpha-1,3-glucosyltransferase